MKKILFWGAIALVCLLAPAVRLLWDGHTLLAAGQAALAAGRTDEAVTTLGRAARMYVPGSPYPGRALAELLLIGGRAEAGADRRLALRSYREIGSALLATRSFYTPRPQLLALANERIARLMAEEEARDPELAKEPAAAREAWHRQVLLRDDAPRPGWAALAVLGAGLLLTTAALLALRGLDEAGRLRRAPCVRLGLLMLLGLLLMVLGLAKA